MGFKNKNEYNELTPKTIAECLNSFSIPIYQRLFEWDEEKIKQLLDDLYNEYTKTSEKYYFGMLTSESINNDTYNLVDGQQRFVVMMLIGIVFSKYLDEWNKFLKYDNNVRLKFLAREDDNMYLNELIEKKDIKELKRFLKNDNEITYRINIKMKNGINEIINFIDQIDGNKKIEFINYVFEKLTFFISDLPEMYSSKDLNKYFERMNSAGKNLENYEILKVECLKNVSENKDFYNQIWNAVSQMDKMLIRPKTKNYKTETQNEVRERYKNTINNIYSIKAINKKNNDIDDMLNDYNDKENDDTIKKILDAFKKNKIDKPTNITRTELESSIISFVEFLLLVLYMRLNDKELKNITVDEFFNKYNLLKTYKEYTKSYKEEDWNKFFIDLLKYRLLYDVYVIRKEGEGEESNYELDNIECDNNEESKKNIIKKKFIKYQSMLNAGTNIKTYYKWIVPLLQNINNILLNNTKIELSYLLNEMIKEDNNDHKKPKIEDLKYGKIDIYYLRRLDYYLWEDNEDSNNKDDIINNFNFIKGGRSVEHLHPQNQDNFKEEDKWDINKIHNFGNLFLISSSFNSTQKNENIDYKFGRILDQIKNHRIESIKLYKIYRDYYEKNKEWTEENMEKHEKEMIMILEKSYK